MECLEERSSYKQESMTVLWDKAKHVKSEIESGYTYHSHCYKLITNKTDINRSKERFDKSKEDSSNILNRTAEISSISDGILLRRIGALHKLAFESTGEKMFDVSRKRCKRCRSFIVFTHKHHSKYIRHYSK